MALPIRQGATHKVVIGPVVAVGDGFTPITNLSLGTADEAEVILHDNATVVDISAYTFAAVTTADGYYQLTLQAGISNTVGHMTVVINDDSLCLPVRMDFIILDTAAYDAIYKDAATMDVNTISVSGTAQTANDNGADINAILLDTADMQPKLGTPAGADMSADIAAVKAETALIVADTDELQLDWKDTGRLDNLLDAILLDTGTTLDNHLLDIKGTGFVKDTDSLPQCLTAAGFSTHAATDVVSAGAITTSGGKVSGVILTDTCTTNTDIGTNFTDIMGTGFVADTHSLVNIEGYTDLIDDATSGLAKIATDVAAILLDTGTNGCC